VNVLALYHDLKKRGVLIEADGENLKVDAPAGVLTAEDKAALRDAKLALLRFLSREPEGEPADDGCRFDARPSKHPGYTSLYDPIEGRWHDWPTKDCYPSVVTLARGGQKKGGAA
jgi:hypothetical protein